MVEREDEGRLARDLISRGKSQCPGIVGFTLLTPQAHNVAMCGISKKKKPKISHLGSHLRNEKRRTKLNPKQAEEKK